MKSMLLSQTWLSVEREMMLMNECIANVLMVDDSLEEVTFTRVMLKHARVVLNFAYVRDGVEAVSYLEKTSPYEGVPCPDLILLDLNMPQMNGREVLQYMKVKNKLKATPVVICSGSDIEKDMEETREMGASGYIIKPLDYENLSKAVLDIDSLVFKTVNGEQVLYSVDSRQST